MGNEVGFLKGLITGQRRLAILRWLLTTPGYCLNDQLLAALLRKAALFHGGESLRDDLEHLERAGAVRLRRIDNLIVAELTRRGGEAAEGLAELDGIPRPGVECPY